MFVEIKKEIKIQSLKSDLRKYYNEYYNVRDRMDCGKALAEHISSTATNAKTNFNKTMDILQKIDPTCPKTRL
jgi:hypothetical protein